MWFKNQVDIFRFSRNRVRTPRFSGLHVKAFGRGGRWGGGHSPGGIWGGRRSPYFPAAEQQNMYLLCPFWPPIGGERGSSKMFNYWSGGLQRFPGNAPKVRVCELLKTQIVRKSKERLFLHAGTQFHRDKRTRVNSQIQF